MIGDELREHLPMVRQVVDALEYGPGWTFTLREHGRPDDASLLVEHVEVRWEVVDVDDPSGRASTFLVAIVALLPLTYIRADQALDWLLHQLYGAVERLEGHERLERFRVNGAPVWAPHVGSGELVCYPSGVATVQL